MPRALKGLNPKSATLKSWHTLLVEPREVSSLQMPGNHMPQNLNFGIPGK
uniref:Uncharacterized protein n=1 Tax=Panagrellus redivivus TaxID=6233 RepID=A0A7E4URC4_PANRE